jgi:hypothetical protein
MLIQFGRETRLVNRKKLLHELQHGHVAGSMEQPHDGSSVLAWPIKRNAIVITVMGD